MMVRNPLSDLEVGPGMADERWALARAMNSFDELLEQVIMHRKPVFIDGERKTAVLISMEVWESTQDKLISRTPSGL